MAIIFRITLFSLLMSFSPLVSIANENVSLQLKWKHAFQFAGYYMALEKGYYDEAGLNVTIIEGNPDRQPLAHVLSEEGSYAVSDSGILLARSKGKPVKVLAAVFQHSPLALAVRKDSGIKRFQDLRGKRVMMQQGGMDASIVAAIHKAGVKDSSYIREDTSYNLDDLILGNTDAFSIYTTDQPHQLKARGVDYNILHPNEYDIDFYGDLLITSEQEVLNHSRRVDAFITASLEGWHYALSHVDETIELIRRKYNTQNLSTHQLKFEARATADMILKDEIELGYISDFRWSRIEKVYVELDLMQKGSNLDGFIYQASPSLLNIAKLYKWQLIVSVLLVVLAIFTTLVVMLRRMVKVRTKSLKDSMALQRSNSEVLEMIANGKPMTVIFEKIIGIYEARYPSMRSSILFLKQDKLYKAAAPNLPDEYNNAIEGLEIGPMVGSCGSAAYSKKRVIVSDIATDPRWAAYTDLALPLNLRACWSQPIIDENGDVLGTFAMYYDSPREPNRDEINDIINAAKLGAIIMERDRSEANLRIEKEQLKASEMKLRGLFELSPLGIALTDMSGHYLEYNKAFQEICGYEKDELNALDYWALTPKRYDADEMKQLQSLNKTNRYGPYEKEYIRKDGSHIPVRLNGLLLNAEDDSQYIWSIVENITQQKAFEEEMRLAATAFETQEGIVVTDSKSRIVRVNKAFTELTGYSEKEAIGNTPAMLNSGRHDKSFYSRLWESLQHNNYWQGEIWNKRKDGSIYVEWLTITAALAPNGDVEHFIGTFSDITNKKEVEEEVHRLAYYDPLTSLPNRRLLYDRLEHALLSSRRNSKHGAILFMDLDNFKALNDTLGHHTGDLLLKQVAERLQLCVRQDDTVARLGGDEFVVILESLSGNLSEAATEVELVAEKILNSLNRSYMLNNHDYKSTPSTGITLFGDELKSVDELLKQADIAMYQAKKEGRNTIRFFDPKMQDVVNKHASLEAKLANAIEKNQLCLHYQIQVDQSAMPTGAEALIRWNHPEDGLISPFLFIDLAEETGLILPIGQWVLETACEQLKKWEKCEAAKHLTLSVNVSAKQFHQADFLSHVQKAVEKYAINPKLLKLEITEGILLEDIESIIETMNELKEIGIQFSLDDFGTGYSSLQYLKRLPLNQLKIDQSFVRDLTTDSNDKAIVATIIAMAQSMNLDVIAEGVETEEHRQLLLDSGCKHYQGYLFSKPVPIEQFEKQLKRKGTT